MSNCRTEEEIKADLSALRRNLSRGVLSMSYDGRSITYRSVAEMRQAEARLEAELADATDSLGRDNRTWAYVGKGY